MMITTAAFLFFTLINGNDTVSFKAADVIDMATPADGNGCAVILDGHDLDTYLALPCSDVKKMLDNAK